MLSFGPDMKAASLLWTLRSAPLSVLISYLHNLCQKTHHRLRLEMKLFDMLPPLWIALFTALFTVMNSGSGSVQTVLSTLCVQSLASIGATVLETRVGPKV